MPKPITRKGIGCRWAYKVKHNSNGDIERLKARFMAKGHTQVTGFDYKEDFSLVAKIVSIRTLLVVASIKRWYVYQMNVSNAFLDGNFSEDAYMNPSLVDD